MRVSSRSGRIATGFALAALGILLWMSLQPGGIRRELVRWFGPPRVVMSEAHATEGGHATFDHSLLDDLLRAFVDSDGMVDYAGLERRREDLDRYIESLGSVSLPDFGRDERLAILINAYNAFTLKLILDHDIPGSIRDIPASKRWKAERWTLGGQVTSLDRIEHEYIRPNFREPRIHFALVCAAVGCPPLRGAAYVGARIDEQLDDQTDRVTHDDRWIRYEEGNDTIELTSLFEWYRGDFDQVAGSILEFVAMYRPDVAASLESGDRPSVRFLPYDWTLNRQ